MSNDIRTRSDPYLLNDDCDSSCCGHRHHPDLSVIIPTYNRPGKTLRAIDSVCTQNLRLEVIVVDDGSEEPFVLPPEIKSVLNVRVLRSHVNLGASGARNLGIRAATAEWITFLDSDDELMPGTLRSRLDFARSYFQQHRQLLTCYACAYRGMDAKRVAYIRYPLPADSVELFAGGCWFCPGSAILMRRDAALQVGPQDEGLRRLEDFDWFLRLAIQGMNLINDPVIGVSVEVAHKPLIPDVDRASRYLLRKWGSAPFRDQISIAAWRRLRAYLLLARASTHWYGGARFHAMLLLAASYLFAPRIRLHPCPGWHTSMPNSGADDSRTKLRSTDTVVGPVVN